MEVYYGEKCRKFWDSEELKVKVQRKVANSVVSQRSGLAQSSLIDVRIKKSRKLKQLIDTSFLFSEFRT